MTVHVAVLFSGGKDSCYAAGWALAQGYDIVLVTMNPEPYSMMFHHPNVQWTKLQAEAMGIKQVMVTTKHDTELNDLEETLRKLKIGAIATGAVASVYQKDRIEAIGKRLGVPVHSPLWHSDEKKLHELLDTMEIYVVAVAAEGLGREFLGKPLRKLVDAKVKNIHPFLEGGEGETFVTNAPFFKKRIEIKGWKISWDGVRGVAEIEDAGLVEKEKKKTK
ncbi:MAG: diphthine--ammonia ligase [Candidatus Micrarchaeota archaeon]